MDKMILLFEEFVMKAITQTEDIMQSDFSQSEKLDSFTDNRDRLFAIIEQISQQVDWTLVSSEKRGELNRQIEYIKKLDEELVIKLQDYQENLKTEIEKAFRQKENVKGYNLNDVK